MNNFLRFSYFLSMIFVHAVLSGQTNRILWAYKTKINEAELSICDGKYNRAARQYRQAFDIKPPFMRDVYNAWVLEALHGNQERAQEYYEVLLDRRISGRYLYFHRSRVEPLHKIPYWKAQFSQLDTAWTRSAMTADFWELLREDQAIRRKCGGSNKDEECNVLMRAVDSVNLIKYIALCQQYDYPNEYKHGKGAPFNSLIWDEIILHNKYLGRHWTDTMLMRKIEEGVLDSRDLNGLQVNEIGAICFITNDELYAPEFSKKQIEQINRFRKTYYLEDVKSYLKKVTFSFQNYHFVFYGPEETPYIEAEGSTSEELSRFMAKYPQPFRVVSSKK